MYTLNISVTPTQIYSWMDTLVAQHPKLVTKQEIGRSYENRPMYVLKVGWTGQQLVFLKTSRSFILLTTQNS